ncbi:hypothetical protein E2P81_ATG05893 [Venturia nashicola]|uniref:Uncharacterized protein n=1 Tax=Venturia nashicola TaxID=86259 RepID=A0A4Z1NWB5_9PEZI|nr:hypothetical protein E6O75_ATG06038 [Venturia nashicola]TLD29599.1 hypothetical protein E2P81_ATG05893 [Venturia nashicola]
MDMLYDYKLVCDLCRQPSRLGFLYKCNQDVYIDNCAKKYLRDFPDAEAIKTSTVAQLRAINMSASVIAQFEQGNVYSQGQIEILKIQKSHMLTVVDQHKAKLPVIPTCNLKCCPSCRPYLKDRVPYSFDAVFAGEVEPLKPDTEQLPIRPAHRMLELGLGPIPPIPPLFPIGSQSTETSDDDDEDDDISISSDEDDVHDDHDHGNREEEQGDMEESDQKKEGGQKESATTRDLEVRERSKHARGSTDIDSSDGAAVTEDSVETATVIPDIVQV